MLMATFLQLARTLAAMTAAESLRAAQNVFDAMSALFLLSLRLDSHQKQVVHHCAM